MQANHLARHVQGNGRTPICWSASSLILACFFANPSSAAGSQDTLQLQLHICQGRILCLSKICMACNKAPRGEMMPNYSVKCTTLVFQHGHTKLEQAKPGISMLCLQAAVQPGSAASCTQYHVSTLTGLHTVFASGFNTHFWTYASMLDLLIAFLDISSNSHVPAMSETCILTCAACRQLWHTQQRRYRI